jgi:hypothetical protein
MRGSVPFVIPPFAFDWRPPSRSGFLPGLFAHFTSGYSLSAMPELTALSFS